MHAQLSTIFVSKVLYVCRVRMIIVTEGYYVAFLSRYKKRNAKRSTLHLISLSLRTYFLWQNVDGKKRQRKKQRAAAAVLVSLRHESGRRLRRSGPPSAAPGKRPPKSERPSVERERRPRRSEQPGAKSAPQRSVPPSAAVPSARAQSVKVRSAKARNERARGRNVPHAAGSGANKLYHV